MSLFGCFSFWASTCFPEVICSSYGPGKVGISWISRKGGGGDLEKGGYDPLPTRIVIGDCHSRMSHTWQYLISSQVLYGCGLNNEILFDSRYWHAVDLQYKRNLLSYIWSILGTLKVMLSGTWQIPPTWHEFCRSLW